MTTSARSIVLHGHFYQPPREDPRTELVPEQPSAAPFHDWNERIEHECYRPITEARVLGGHSAEDGPDEVINCLEWMSFNFGPTLLWWMERHAPETYRAVLEADAASVARLGHGNAMAMPYHHPILPLSAPRDRRTEIRWGIADFRARFGREPEGMWLPETAVDAATLDAMAAEGIRYTVLAPHQVDPVPDDGKPVRHVTASGHEIALFIYDGTLSHGVAFGSLLRDGVAWADLMLQDDGPGGLRSLATDGETFGHHHKFAEMALAKAITEVRGRGRDGVRLENFGSYLAREGAHARATLVEPTAWSCAHGVGRWMSDCGCRSDVDGDSSQAWRGPLRAALEWLAESLHAVFEEEGTPLFGDPWAARDGYGEVVGSVDPAARDDFVREALAGGSSGRGSAPEKRGHALLEMERNVLRSFTSCAWFFDDIGGLEPRQVLGYAARAIEVASVAAPSDVRARCEDIHTGFTARLAAAVSNDPDIGTAADVFANLEAAPP